jgi:hypothetical protein
VLIKKTLPSWVQANKQATTRNKRSQRGVQKAPFKKVPVNLMRKLKLAGVRKAITRYKLGALDKKTSLVIFH